MQPKKVYLMVGALICALICSSQIAQAQVNSKKDKKEPGEMLFKGKLKPLKLSSSVKAKSGDKEINEIVVQSNYEGDWRDEEKSRFIYSVDRLEIREELFFSDGDEWVHHKNNTYTFREDKRLSSFISEYVSEELSYKFSLFYNEQGRLDSIEYIEPGYGRELTELIYHTPDSITFIYDGVADLYSYMLLSDGNLYEIYSYENYIDRYIYYGVDLDGYMRQLSDVFYFVDIYNDELYNEEEGFVPYSRVIHQKENGLVTNRKDDLYDKENEEWVPEYKTEYIYSGNEIIENEVSYFDDFWIIGYRSLFTYETTVSNEPNEEKAHFRLAQNYPNPFNPSTTISFTLEKPEEINIKIYNVLGEQVTLLFSGAKTAGDHQISFDASFLPSGIYYYVLASENHFKTKAMTLLK